MGNPDLINDINDMHRKYEVHVWIQKRIENGEWDVLKAFLEFRMKFIKEEFDETLKAIKDSNAEEVVDGLIDIIVVAIGTLNAMDVDVAEAWDSVHNANMAKKVGVKPGRPNPLGLPDLVKPEGWTSPNHKGNVGAIGQTLNPSDFCKCYSCFMRKGY